ncbi:hypothetical protein J2746_001730 [Methanolobus bombayensis]|nr:hypothetical protein [Methanolobus bombayensis]
MAQIRRHFEHMGMDNTFNEYDSLAISPLHVHRSKAEHKHAIFVLGNDIAEALSQDDTSGIGRTSERMHELAIKTGSHLANTN